MRRLCRVAHQHLTPAPRSNRIVVSCGQEDDELISVEQDGTAAEDEECAWFAAVPDGPGCTVSDSDLGYD
jgi:hypothetical protein